ncbi:MAG: ABC-F family ATP-binding cassette domain-containing protein [Rhodobiaceae bacterium]|nr:ABC-F family ATP-binding cassette domain-containing protein [Rhodobiaceae bacterium]
MPPFLVAGDKVAYLLPDSTDLFSDISFSIRPRQKVALVGPNGCGKSSLARLLANERAPARGHIAFNGCVSLLAQDAAPPQGMRVVDFLQVGQKFDALKRSLKGTATPADLTLIADDWDLEDALDRELQSLGLKHVSPTQRLTDLSGGEWLRLQLLRTQRASPDLLILDEPSNHLDQEGRAWLEDWLRQAPFAWLLISHDRHLLSLPNQIWELNPKGLDFYGGNYGTYLAEKTAQDEAAIARVAHAKKAEKQAKRDQQAARERHEGKAAKGRRERDKRGQPKITLDGREARSQKTASRLTQIREARVSGAEDRVAIARSALKDKSPVQFDAGASEVLPHQPVLTLEALCFSYGDRLLLNKFGLAVKGPQRVHLAGENGSGKSTLLDLISGEKVADTGLVDRRVPVGYLLQRERHVIPETPLERCRAYRPAWKETDIRTSLARAGLRREKAVIAFDQLSAGERLRADLVRLLNCPEPAHLLLLDEPSNHLDIDALEALEAVLKTYRGALIFTSHDPVFVENMDVSDTVQLSPR